MQVESKLVVLSVVTVFVVYFLGVSPSVFGGDSGDVIMSAWFGGIAHAPGYPLNAIFGWLFTHLPYEASLAFKANLMATFFTAGTVGVLFLILQKLLKNILLALIFSLVYAFNPLVWLYAHVLEVFQLNVLLVAISFYFLLCWRESIFDKKSKNAFLHWAIFFLGLAFFHHQTSILMAPAFVYFINHHRQLMKSKINFTKLAFFFLLGFIPNFYLIIASYLNAPTNWVKLGSVGDFFSLIFRAEYGSFVAAGSLLGANLASRLSQIFYFGLLVKSDFQLVAMVLLVFGSFYAFLKDRSIFWTVLLAVIFTGPVFLFYAAFPIHDDFYQGLWERFVLLTYLFLVIFMGYGSLFVLRLLEKKLSQIFSNVRVLGLLKIVVYLIIFTVPSGLFYSNYTKTDMSKFKLGNWLGQDFLSSADKGAIVFLLGDTITFNTEYIYYTSLTDEHIRSLQIIRGGSLSDLEYRERVLKMYPDIHVPSDYYSSDKHEGMHFIEMIISENKDRFPIYIIEDAPDVEGYRWMSSGLLLRLVDEDDYNAEYLTNVNKSVFGNFRYANYGEDNEYEHFLATDIKRIYYYYTLRLADEFTALDQLDEAREYLDMNTRIDPNNKEAYLRIGHINYLRGDCISALNSFNQVLALDKSDPKILRVIAGLHKDCFKNEELANQYNQRALDLERSLVDKPLENF